MRGLHTQVSDLRKDVFVEVARIAYESDNINDDLESIPYKLSPDENPRFRDSVYRERAVSSERTRLALGYLFDHRINRFILPAVWMKLLWMRCIMNHL